MAFDRPEQDSINHRAGEVGTFSLTNASARDMSNLFSKDGRNFTAGTDSRFLLIRSFDTTAQLAQADDGPAKARERVVDVTAREIAREGRLSQDGNAALFIQAAIKHQYDNNGGAAAADSLGKDISDKLPNGMQLKISKDAAFEKKVGDYYRSHNLPLPEYIRKVELFDRDGKSLGSIGITIGDERTPPGQRI